MNHLRCIALPSLRASFPAVGLALLTAALPAQFPRHKPRLALPIALEPAGRIGHGAAFDAARGVLVVCGGIDGTAALAETLEVTGPTWTRLTPNPAPPAGNGVRLAYDADARLVYLHGGNDALLWSWNGSTWTSINRGGPPMARSGHVMAWDSRRKKLVLHGGSWIDFGANADTWEYDSQRGWTAITVKDPPEPRTGAAMVDVPIFSGVYMFGGLLQRNSFYTSQAWVWNGRFWSDGGSGPTGRAELAMCYDSDQGVIVVFGGFDGTKVLGDVWCGYGASWSEKTPATGPSPGPRRGATLVYDSRAKRCVLFGGVDANGRFPSDVWEWDVNTLSWSKRTVAPAPAPTIVVPAPDLPRRGR